MSATCSVVKSHRKQRRIETIALSPAPGLHDCWLCEYDMDKTTPSRTFVVWLTPPIPAELYTKYVENEYNSHDEINDESVGMWVCEKCAKRISKQYNYRVLGIRETALRDKLYYFCFFKCRNIKSRCRNAWRSTKRRMTKIKNWCRS